MSREHVELVLRFPRAFVRGNARVSSPSDEQASLEQLFDAPAARHRLWSAARTPSGYPSRRQAPALDLLRSRWTGRSIVRQGWRGPHDTREEIGRCTQRSGDTKT